MARGLLGVREPAHSGVCVCVRCGVRESPLTLACVCVCAVGCAIIRSLWRVRVCALWSAREPAHSGVCACVRCGVCESPLTLACARVRAVGCARARSLWRAPRAASGVGSAERVPPHCCGQASLAEAAAAEKARYDERSRAQD
eukprot:512784-Prymnesium_polylepis.1